MLNDLLVPVTAGFVVWYCGYSFETALNGGMGNGWTMAFRYLWRDIKCNLPFIGWHYRLQLTNNDVEWAKALPGIFYIAWTHITVPILVGAGVYKLMH